MNDTRTRRKIGVVTVARSDYGIYRPILRAIAADPTLDLQLFVSGMHLSPEFGLTVQEVEADGYPIVARVEMLLASDTPQAVSKSMGLGTIGLAQAYAQHRPDLLVVLGDRFEMLAAALAALPFAIPTVHLYGGDSTEGAMDESIRHALTKMCHLHCVSTEVYRRRVIQMGEEPWRVKLTGISSLDNIHQIDLLSPAELAQRIDLPLSPPPLLVTFHPVTLEYEKTAAYIDQLLGALYVADLPMIFTYPNADTSGHTIIDAIDHFVETHPKARVVTSLGTQAYFSLMRYAAAMVGNSSSGIIEAASFALPVVNIGNRQRGRIHGANVIDVDCDRDAILQAILQATEPSFRQALTGMANPYGDGHAAQRIVELLRSATLDQTLIAKRFYNLPIDILSAPTLNSVETPTPVYAL